MRIALPIWLAIVAVAASLGADASIAAQDAWPDDPPGWSDGPAATPSAPPIGRPAPSWHPLVVPITPKGALVGHDNVDPAEAAQTCLREDTSGGDAFAECWAFHMTSQAQWEVGNCIAMSSDWTSAGFCMAGRGLSDKGKQIVRCAETAIDDPFGAANCALNLGGKSSEGVRLAGCASVNADNFWGMAMCAGGKRLTPEQQVYAECAYQVGLQPYAFVGCAGGRLTLNELNKCLQRGIGGDGGCFGPNNEATKLVRALWSGVAGGPNSVLNRPTQIFGGPHSVFRDPAQIYGGKNSIFNNPDQIFGGQNSVFRNPDQVLGGKNSFFHKNLGIHL